MPLLLTVWLLVFAAMALVLTLGDEDDLMIVRRIGWRRATCLLMLWPLILALGAYRWGMQ
jgi:hypothetical protein